MKWKYVVMGIILFIVIMKANVINNKEKFNAISSFRETKSFNAVSKIYLKPVILHYLRNKHLLKFHFLLLFINENFCYEFLIRKRKITSGFHKKKTHSHKKLFKRRQITLVWRSKTRDMNSSHHYCLNIKIYNIEKKHLYIR